MSQIVAKEGEISLPVTKKYFTVKKFAAKNKESGTWPDSESAIWALRAESPQNGFRSAFLNVGRRVLIDEARFWEAITCLQETKNVSSK